MSSRPLSEFEVARAKRSITKLWAVEPAEEIYSCAFTRIPQSVFSAGDWWEHGYREQVDGWGWIPTMWTYPNEDGAYLTDQYEGTKEARLLCDPSYGFLMLWWKGKWTPFESALAEWSKALAAELKREDFISALIDSEQGGEYDRRPC